jgi:hypothetical protein
VLPYITLPFAAKKTSFEINPERINRFAIYSSSIISKLEDEGASKGNAMALEEVNENSRINQFILIYKNFFFAGKRKMLKMKKVNGGFYYGLYPLNISFFTATTGSNQDCAHKHTS